MGPKPVEVEADICRLFSDQYREEGLRIQQETANQCPPRLTDQDWFVPKDTYTNMGATPCADCNTAFPCSSSLSYLCIHIRLRRSSVAYLNMLRHPSPWEAYRNLPVTNSRTFLPASAAKRVAVHPVHPARRATVMDRGPSQWRMKVPPEALINVTNKELARPIQGRRRWSSVIGLGPPVVPTVEGVAMNLKSASQGTSPTTQGAPSAGGGEELCEVEVLQEGCCTIRFDTMKHLIDQIGENAKVTESARLSPALPLTDQAKGVGQAILIEAAPIVLQSTLPLPQQVTTCRDKSE